MNAISFPGAARPRQELQARLQKLDQEMTSEHVPPEATYVYPTPNDSDWSFVFTDHPRFKRLMPEFSGATLGEMKASAQKAEAEAAEHLHGDRDHRRNVEVSLGFGALIGLVAGASIHPGLGIAGAAVFGIPLGLYVWSHESNDSANLSKMMDADFFQQKLPRWGNVLEREGTTAAA